MNALDWACFGLLIIGAINWGVLGIAEINIVDSMMGAIFQDASAEIVTRTIYAFVGVAGIYFLYPLFRISQTGRERDQATTVE